MICGFLQSKDLITYRILIFQEFLTFQLDQLSNNPSLQSLLFKDIRGDFVLFFLILKFMLTNITFELSVKLV